MRSPKWLILVIVLLAFPAMSGANGQAQFTASRAAVYYFGFDIERITGIPEHQIDQYGCRYTIEREKFISLLVKAPDMSSKYDQRDIRAHISISADEQYFVNREGIVRFGDRYFIIEKRDFVNLLSPHRAGKCR